MLIKSKFAKSESTWFGLNKPDMNICDADMIIFGIPFDGAVSYRSGAADAPKFMRENSLTATPFTENFASFQKLNIHDAGDFIFDGDRASYFRDIEDFVSKIVHQKKFFCMIGGDHSTTIPVMQGVDRGLEHEFGIIHIDAHFDLCDSMDGDKFSHGSTERRALDLVNISSTDNIFFIGIRSIEPDEYEFKKENNINVISASMYHRLESDRISAEVIDKMKNFKYIYLTIDIDCLDPAFAAGTGTPQFGGLYSRQLLVLLSELFSSLNIIGVDIVEIAPNLDPSLSSMFAGRKLLSEIMGYHATRIGKLEE